MIQRGAMVRGHGKKPLGLLAMNTIDVKGAIDVSSDLRWLQVRRHRGDRPAHRRGDPLRCALYNAGNREGCFRVYEGIALTIQREVPCAGVRSAFESSIQHASSLGTYGEQAWALRDAFDGMLDAAKRWHDPRPQAAPPAQP